MKTIPSIILIASLDLAAVHSCIAASTITFADGYFWANEEQGTALVEMHRSGDTSSTATIDYATVEGTAKPVVDYIGTSGTLAFAPGESSKHFSITVLDNGWLDGDRTLSLRLSNPLGATLGPYPSGTLRIADNEVPLMVDRTFQPQIGELFEDFIRAMVLQPDGRIIIGGYFDHDTNVIRLPQTFMMRLLPNGSRDSTFKAPPQLTNAVRALALQADGKILVAVDQGTLLRLNMDGSWDRGFRSDLAGSSSLVVQSDGKIISVNGSALVRLNNDGSLDMPFSKTVLACSDVQTAAIQSDGKLILGGVVCTAGKAYEGLVRFKRDDTVDAVFPLTLAVHPDRVRFDTPRLRSIVPLAGGKMLISGRFYFVNGVISPGIARLNADGSLDASFRFSELSFSWLPDLPSWGEVASPILQPDGKILVPFEWEWYSGILIRINSNGSLDREFRMPYRWPSPLVLQENGNILMGNLRLFGDPGRVKSFAWSHDWDSNPLDSPVRFNVAKQNTELRVTVRRLGESTEAVTVGYTARAGTAQAGSNYLPQTGTLTFAPLETTKTITVPILDPPSLKRERSFSLVLSNASNGGILGVSSEATVLILPQQLLTLHYPTASVSGPIRLTLAPTTPGVSYSLWAWTDLAVRWQSLSIQQKTAAGDTLEFEDTTAIRPAQRFYRAFRAGP
ncbi:MAG: hypothetical protein HY735_08510 [Verrucomicrobia bacterium]|nr:hypothetical protein [Verrucomicrobiota bacterium]